ncbi:MAG: phosphodiester glycosidase family protein, partial [Oscillospiraceae bacterium]|nr:phosphodiester glycosidase family protein [Oscillospiraceae bacterium]
MKTRLVKRILCIILSLCMLSSFALALTYGQSRQDAAVSLAQGALWHEGIWDDSSSRVSENYIEYSPNPSVHPVVAYGSKLYGTSTYKTAAAYLEQQGKKITAVINGDFFNTSSGLPNGIVITDGIVRGSDGYQWAVGFKADGSTVIGKPSMAMSFSSPTAYGSIAAVNRALSSAGVFLYTPDFSATTRSDLKAVYVILRPVSGELTMQCSVSATVEEVKLSSKAISIPEGCMILAATANNSNYNALSAMTAGQSVTVSTSCAAGWQDVVWAVGAKELLVENGRAVSSLSNSAAPRTAVGIKADGSVIFYTVDGRQTDHSAGAGLADLAKRLVELGCITAVNLDGGGSTAMGILIPGTNELTTVNSPSDGSLRKCANFIFLVNDAPQTGFAQRLHIYPAQKTALAGAEVSFTAGATDANGHYTLSGGINFSANGGSVTPQGVFTAPQSADPFTVTASAPGLSASASVEVVSAADKVSIYRSSTRVTDKKLTLAPGSVTDFSAKAWYLSRQLACSDELFTWQVSGNIGSVSPEGVFTATNIETGASGTLTLTSGSAKAVVNINISGTCAVLEDFEASTLAIEGEGASLEVCRDLTKVRYGMASGTLSFTGAPDGAKTSYVKVSLPLADGLSQLCGWVKGDGSQNTLLAKLEGEDELIPLCSLSSKDWSFFAIELPSGAKAVSELHIEGKGSGAVWLDTLYQSKA